MLKKMFANLFLGLTAAGLGQLNAAGLDLTSGGLTLKAEPSGELSGLLVDNREYLAGAQQPFSAFDAATGEQESFSGTFQIPPLLPRSR